VGCCDSPPKPSFIVGPGEYLLAGKARPDGQLWWAKLDASGKSMAVNVANDGELTPLVAITNTGVLFGAYTASSNRARVVRLGQKLEQVWGTPARSSAHCCFQGSNHVGKCGDSAGCELNEQCTHDDQCASGKCLLGVAVCSVPCTQSKDCPANTYCAEACSVKPCISVCLPECVGKNASYCSSLDPWRCQETQNTEGVEVSLCQP